MNLLAAQKISAELERGRGDEIVGETMEQMCYRRSEAEGDGSRLRIRAHPQPALI